MSTQEDFFSIASATSTVEVSGKTFHVREISGEEFDWLRDSVKAKNGTVDEKGVMARYVVVGLSDPDGKRLFANSDLAKVNAKPLAVLKKLTEAIQAHNGLGLPAKEDPAGKSETTSS